MIYLVHFDKKLKHARHYLGYTGGNDQAKRVARHKEGRGARLLAVLGEKGIGWKVVRTWKGPLASRDNERRLKNIPRKLLCPVCSGKAAFGRGKLHRVAL